MNSPATARLRRNSRLAMIIAGVFALLASLAVTAPAQAGYYGGYGSGYGYGSGPCGYRCGPCGYRCAPYRHYYHGCYSGGCYRRSGVVYEKRYIERELVVRRYGYGGGWGRPYYRNRCGYSPCGGYGGGYYRGAFPYGYGGVRDWRSPYGYGYGYGPSGYGYAEGPPRPPEAIPYGDDY